ncbi:DUF1561 family protein [Campylobacter sp. RM16704]|uniref:DUF1561 family protein n=1 Tax=Campylobacter sp. RM16704 TaxID=1500960 RepID=UPI00057D8E40|nr:DUF1561 family protein [Campylobacter sp. RM16704]AJC85860.1 putative protein (DUF1561 domain) [Campylobacter sp. RM16704]
MKIILFLTLLIATLYAQNSVIQKRANIIQDSRLLVQTHGERPRCLSPVSFDGDIFLRVQECNGASITRYDIFKRIAFRYKNEWLCLSLREGLTKGRGDKDHLVLRPCVLNDDTQWFDIKNNEFSLSKYPNIKLFEFNNLILASKVNFGNKVKLFKPVMKEWLESLAPPINYDIKTSIAFNTINPQTRVVKTFFINPNGAGTKKFDFFYDPTKGYIKTYNINNARFSCLTSNLNNKTSSTISWTNCPQINLSPNTDPYAWNFDISANSFILDVNGNILDVARGSDFGKFFIITKKEFVKQGLYTSDFSGIFIFNKHFNSLRNFIARNISFQNDTCGNEKRFKRDIINDSLANFDPLKGGWRRKFFDISTSTDGNNAFNGICGYCLLHTYEILALLTEVFPINNQAPIGNIGYFFNYRENTNPLESFRLRSPTLSNTLFFSLNYWGDSFYTNEPLYLRASRAVEAVTRLVLPHRNWEIGEPVFSRDLFAERIQDLLNAPTGSVFIALLNTNPNVAFDGHAMPIIRTNQGVIVVPTNIQGISFTDYADFIRPVNTIEEIRLRLSTNNSYEITALNFIQMQGPIEDTLSSLLSQNNCSGEGNRGRRGNGLNLNPRNANSCDAKKCSLMEWEEALQ